MKKKQPHSKKLYTISSMNAIFFYSWNTKIISLFYLFFLYVLTNVFTDFCVCTQILLWTGFFIYKSSFYSFLKFLELEIILFFCCHSNITDKKRQDEIWWFFFLIRGVFFACFYKFNFLMSEQDYNFDHKNNRSSNCIECRWIQIGLHKLCIVLIVAWKLG